MWAGKDGLFKKVRPTDRSAKKGKKGKEYFNADGEPGSNGASVVTIGRLADAVNRGDLQLEKADDISLVSVLEAWVSPLALWKLPLIRVDVRYELLADWKVAFTFHVYASRLLFHCIADPTLKMAMNRIVPVVPPVHPLQVDPPSDEVYAPAVADDQRGRERAFAPDALLLATESHG